MGTTLVHFALKYMFGHKFGLLGATADFDKVLTTLNFMYVDMYVVMRLSVSKTKRVVVLSYKLFYKKRFYEEPRDFALF